MRAAYCQTREPAVPVSDPDEASKDSQSRVPRHQTAIALESVAAIQGTAA